MQRVLSVSSAVSRAQRLPWPHHRSTAGSSLRRSLQTSTMRHYLFIRAVCLVGCLLLVSAARPLTTATPAKAARAAPPKAPRSSRTGSSLPSLRQTTLVPLPVEERVIFDAGDLEVEDYLENIYAGTVAVAQADPFIAAAGAGVSVGVPFTYEDQGSYDYEFGLGQGTIGVGAKGVAASVAKLRQALISKAAARAQAASTVAYSQNRLAFNTLTASRTDAAALSASGGGYIVRQQDNPDDFLVETPELDPLVFGKK